ncbi:hypothetical protein [Paenibacillus ginsengarvi]|uniref:Type II secretion system protein GspF domain-containing protein n=1 Tax=Paenibacillus ginsengarvi TaxID=400777 RepID=A0A3B0BK57_9BACL|nr:hypothetical protein [Paenibacillus ginsengarvi]RKN71846.1 hypothetical protein D7M11_28865 [Paenibacillus ginsengarvi]
MIMESRHLLWLQALAHGALFAAIFTAVLFTLRSLPRRRRRWRFAAFKRFVQRRTIPAFVLKIAGISERWIEASGKERLLLESGLRFNPLLYELMRRVLLLLGAALAALGYSGLRSAWGLPWIEPVYVLVAGLIVLVLFAMDRVLLESLGKHRTYKIMREIYTLSNQLLYYNGSKMNLHAKLGCCLPFCHKIRPDLQLLLNEWYEDAEQAIKRFKRRLGTEEAYSFAETINSLRLNEHDSYYMLLRDRIQDYKEKLDMAKDSRKESTSYVLFVIAGIPILNTFRIFIYPWVQEGQKLFDSLH